MGCGASTAVPSELLTHSQQLRSGTATLKVGEPSAVGQRDAASVTAGFAAQAFVQAALSALAAHTACGFPRFFYDAVATSLVAAHRGG